MYDYNEKLDYYNFVNNNYNQPMFAKNESPNTVVDPYNGFIMGNMFSSLYNSYKFEPRNLQPSTEQEQLLNTLDALCFAKEDLNLYLDVNPNDRDMINLFNQYRMEADKVLNEYEKKYGPIFVDSVANSKVPWAWNDGPWPWERK